MRHALALAIFLLSACQNQNQNQSQNTATLGAATRGQAIAVADAYLTARHHHPPSVVDAIDMGDRWRLAYSERPGEGGTGGVRLVVVNKRSGEVVHMEAEQ